MTGIVKRIASPVDAQEKLHLSDAAYKHFFRKVAGETFRGFFILLSTIVMFTLLTVNMTQLIYINSSLDKLDRNFNFGQQASQEVKEISVLAAYCAKLPESTTVAKTQLCIETNIRRK